MVSKSHIPSSSCLRINNFNTNYFEMKLKHNDIYSKFFRVFDEHTEYTIILHKAFLFDCNEETVNFEEYSTLMPTLRYNGTCCVCNGMCCREKYTSTDLINDNKNCLFAADVSDTCSLEFNGYFMIVSW